MPTNFLVESTAVSLTPSPTSDLDEQPVDREPLRILVIGSRRGVISTIQTLYRLRFAEVREWSPLMPGPNPGEVMSILTRYILVNEQS